MSETEMWIQHVLHLCLSLSILTVIHAMVSIFACFHGSSLRSMSLCSHTLSLSSCILGWPSSCYVTKNGLGFLILLPHRLPAGLQVCPTSPGLWVLGWNAANWACKQDTTNQTTLPLPSFLLHFCVCGCTHIYVNTRMFLVWSSSENVLNYGFSVSLIGSSFLGFAFYYLNTFSMSDESCSHIIRLQGDLTCGIKTQSSSLWATKGSINIFKGASRPVLTETAPQFQVACCFLIIRFQLLLPKTK